MGNWPFVVLPVAHAYQTIGIPQAETVCMHVWHDVDEAC